MLDTLLAVRPKTPVANYLIWLVPVGCALSVFVALGIGGGDWSSAALYAVAALIVAGLFTYSVAHFVKLADKPKRQPRSSGR